MAITFENVFDVSAEEENGRVVRLRRAGYIRGLTSTSPMNYVAEILSSGALPSGNTIVNGSILQLKRRAISLDDDAGLGDARVDLFYERGEGSSEGGTGSTPTLRGGSSLKQVETVYDGEGQQISVTHTWPAEDEGVYPSGKPRAGTTNPPQGGTIRVLVPMSRLSGAFQKATASPGALTESYIGHVNASTWQGGAPRTWMCTQADFELIDDTVSPPLYEFRFAFERDPETWDNDTTVRFTDPNTGEPPDGLVEGVGIKKIIYYPEKDFNADF